MKFNGDHVYFYLEWNGMILAVYGKLFKRDIDIELNLTLHIFAIKEIDDSISRVFTHTREHDGRW